ncbi:uncharacterized protein LOC117927170 isoform X2 [Vitis riparia]|uniref:uncharacterized protein LOC117927170 isoform X2 n=1 Tax=Vitis riparia TaxID=96939 RepID=UPI00155AA501|nr:uncharacterized protein LOC117927170 isoform X2 [Vitis riparia]
MCCEVGWECFLGHGLMSVLVHLGEQSLLGIYWGFLQQEESEFGLPGGNGQLLTLGLGLLATALAAVYVTRLAKPCLFENEILRKNPHPSTHSG